MKQHKSTNSYLSIGRAALLLACISVGCAKFSELPRTLPGHRPRDLVIGSWSPPANLKTPTYFELLRELGFSHTLYWRSPLIDQSRWKDDLDLAKALGINLIFDSWQPDKVPQNWLGAIMETACDHPAFAGVYLPDEPGYRYPLESHSRKPSAQNFKQTLSRLRDCGRGDLFLVDAAAAETQWINMFLPYATTFGIDIYPYKNGIDWKERVRLATLEGRHLAGLRPLWMVLQGHGRGDWFSYATHKLHLVLPPENDPRPSPNILLQMAQTAIVSGADGIWWWSFELYDWNHPEHREFIRSFGKINRFLAGFKMNAIPDY